MPLLLSIIFQKPLPNPLFTDLHAIDIVFDITVTLHLLSQALTHLYLGTTRNHFRLILFHHTKKYQQNTSGVDTAFSQHSFFLLFTRPTFQNPRVLSSDIHLLNIDLTTDQYSTPPTPNRIDYPLIVTDTLVSNPCQDPRFLYLGTKQLILILKFQTNVVVKNCKD